MLQPKSEFLSDTVLVLETNSVTDHWWTFYSKTFIIILPAVEWIA